MSNDTIESDILRSASRPRTLKEVAETTCINGRRLPKTGVNPHNLVGTFLVGTSLLALMQAGDALAKTGGKSGSTKGKCEQQAPLENPLNLPYKPIPKVSKIWGVHNAYYSVMNPKGDWYEQGDTDPLLSIHDSHVGFLLQLPPDGAEIIKMDNLNDIRVYQVDVERRVVFTPPTSIALGRNDTIIFPSFADQKGKGNTHGYAVMSIVLDRLRKVLIYVQATGIRNGKPFEQSGYIPIDYCMGKVVRLAWEQAHGKATAKAPNDKLPGSASPPEKSDDGSMPEIWQAQEKLYGVNTGWYDTSDINGLTKIDIRNQTVVNMMRAHQSKIAHTSPYEAQLVTDIRDPDFCLFQRGDEDLVPVDDFPLDEHCMIKISSGYGLQNYESRLYHKAGTPEFMKDLSGFSPFLRELLHTGTERYLEKIGEPAQGDPVLGKLQEIEKLLVLLEGAGRKQDKEATLAILHTLSAKLHPLLQARILSDTDYGENNFQYRFQWKQNPRAVSMGHLRDCFVYVEVIRVDPRDNTVERKLGILPIKYLHAVKK